VKEVVGTVAWTSVTPAAQRGRMGSTPGAGSPTRRGSRAACGGGEDAAQCCIGRSTQSIFAYPLSWFARCIALMPSLLETKFAMHNAPCKSFLRLPSLLELTLGIDSARTNPPCEAISTRLLQLLWLHFLPHDAHMRQASLGYVWFDVGSQLLRSKC
jgi:hypothetical protein